MRYQLSTGREVEVWFNHQYDFDENDQPVPYGTHCTVVLEGKEGTQHFEIESHCHPNDQFTKLKGRLHSFRKLFGKTVMTREERKKKNLPVDEAYITGVAFDFLSSEERDELFNLVFPKFRGIQYEDVLSDKVVESIEKQYKDNPKLLKTVTNYLTNLYKKTVGR